MDFLGPVYICNHYCSIKVSRRNGTMASRRFYTDNRTIAHKGSEGRVLAWQTYRQKKSIVQNINISKVEDAENTTQSVLFNGQPALTMQSIIINSSGDELTDGGIINGGLKSQSTRILQGSSGVLVEGHEMVREADKCEPNRGNGPLEPLIQPGGYVPKAVREQFNLKSPKSQTEGKYTVIKVKGHSGDHFSGTIDVASSNQPAKPSKVTHHSVYQSKHLLFNQKTKESKDSKETNEEGKGSYLIFHHLPESSEYTHFLTLPDVQNNAYPIPLFKDPGDPELGLQDQSAANNPSNNLSENIEKKHRMELNIGYLVAKNKEEKFHLLPEGWLYVYVDDKLWREIQVKRYTSFNEAIYDFSDVNLSLRSNPRSSSNSSSSSSSSFNSKENEWKNETREATVETQSDILIIPSLNAGRIPKVEVLFSEEQLNWDTAQKGASKKPIEIVSLPNIESNWIEQEQISKLQDWQYQAPDRDVFVIPVSTVLPLGFLFKYTDNRPYSYQNYKIQLGKKIFEGRLDGEGYTPYLNITASDLQETLVIDHSEMINLDLICPYPTHRQEIILEKCLSNPQHFQNNYIVIRVFPTPMVINLEENAIKNTSSLLNYTELQGLKHNGQKVIIFVHGFNTEFGQFGRYPRSASLNRQPLFQLDDTHTLNLNPNSLLLHPSKYKRTLCCPLDDPKELLANFKDLNPHQTKLALAAYKNNPEGEGELESSLNGTGAHHWFTHMEYNFNVAKGFHAPHYEKYTRMIGIHWPGNVNILEFNRAEEIAHQYGLKLCSLLQQLSREKIEINIVAHSLGARLLLRAMEILGSIDKKHEEIITKAVFWQAAIPDTAFTTCPTVYTDKRVLSRYTHAVASAKSILVLHSEHDLILKTPYPISKRIGATLSEILLGQTGKLKTSSQSHSPILKAPAMGYKGPRKELSIIQLINQGKLQIIDQQDYLTGHSHMKVPSQSLMENVYKKTLM